MMETCAGWGADELPVVVRERLLAELPGELELEALDFQRFRPAPRWRHSVGREHRKARFGDLIRVVRLWKRQPQEERVALRQNFKSP